MTLRAIHPEEKEQRRETLLDATEALWLRQSERLASVADIARAAGLAKGTVYLYFASKEELFLALHERQVNQFFDRVEARAAKSAPMDLDVMVTLTRNFLEGNPSFLPLATLCHGLMERSIPLEVGYRFLDRTHNHLGQTVHALQTHFPDLTPAIMLESYGLLLGLWQLLRPTPLKALMKQRSPEHPCADDYFAMLDAALRALWRGSLNTETPHNA